MEGARTSTSEQLMAEMAWVKRLARALVKDDAAADDITQDTWVIASEQKPDSDRPLRPWLGRVVANLVHTRRRGEVRRQQRQAAFVDDRAVPTPRELTERVELQRALAEELLALEEPYRSTVMLRFVEGYSSIEIARRLGIPDGTVRRRLKVALDQLREGLRKRTDQPRRGWLAALVPFARLPDPIPTPTEALMIKKVIGGVMVLVALAVAGAIVWHHHAGGRGRVIASAPLPIPERRNIDVGPVSTAVPSWIAQRDAPPRRIAGRVVFRGTPVAGAKVQLALDVAGEMNPFPLLPASFSKLLQPLAEISSGADGTFDFGVQPAAAFTVSAATADHAAVAAAVGNADPLLRSDQLVLSLGDCHSRAIGVVSDASGGGIAKARVSIAGFSIETDTAGKYSMCIAPRDGGVGSPSNSMRVEADGYGTVRQEIIVVGDLHLDFKLAPEAVLVGRVTTSDGRPASGARVIASPAPGPNTWRFASGWAATDSDGKFRIAGLSPAEFNLFAMADNLVSRSLTVVARPAMTSRELAVTLDKLSQVRGEVSMSGSPVAGAFVLALHDGVPNGAAISQADGSFTLNAASRGSITFVARPYRVVQSAPENVDRAVVEGVRIEVAKMASVHGHVTRHGLPVSGADVMYVGAPQASSFGASPITKADANGAYTIEGLPPVAGSVSAWDTPTSKAFSDPVPVSLEYDDDKEVDVELANAGDVKGTIVDQAGNSIASAYVRMDNGRGDMCESTTDASGQFDCTMLSGGSYHTVVYASPGGHLALPSVTGNELALIDVPKDGQVTGVKLVVKDERAAIRGTVIDDAGAAMADVQVKAIGPGPATMDAPTTMSDRDGHFEIVDLARGSYTVQATAADGGETALPNIATGNAPVTLKLVRSGAIDGTFVDFSSMPDVFVLQNRAAGDLKRPMIDGAGFSKIGLTPGQYTVLAQAGAQVDAQTVDVHPGETVKVTLRNRGAGTVEGTVSDFAKHTPLAGLRCDARVLAPGQTVSIPPAIAEQAYSDPLGHFSVSAPLGHVRIFCFAVNGELRSAAGGDVEVTQGTAAKLTALSVQGVDDASTDDHGFAIDPLALPVVVGGITPSGTAAVAGLRVGDLVVAIDGVPVQGLLPDGVITLVGNHPRSAPLMMTVSRAGATKTITLPSGTPPT